MISVVLMPAVGIAAFTPLTASSSGVVLAISAYGLSLPPLLLLGLWVARRISAPNARRACLMFRLCPSCAYALAGAGAEADGCVVCAECGSAWKMDLSAATARGREVAGER